MPNPRSDEIEKVRRLFHQDVPEVASRIVEIRGVVREVGKECILVVHSKDPAVDAVGACVGARGSRVKQIATELSKEHITIVRWSDSVEEFINGLLAEAHLDRISLKKETQEAVVYFENESKRPEPDRLALQSKLLLQLTGWKLKLELLDES